MAFNDDLEINMYAQGLVEADYLIVMFNTFSLEQKHLYLRHILFFIGQSKPSEDDISSVIEISRLRPTFTPCVLLKKGVKYHNLIKIAELSENELVKSLILLLSLFRIAYLRRFKQEMNSYKWWYWDFSDPKNIEKAKNLYSV